MAFWFVWFLFPCRFGLMCSYWLCLIIVCTFACDLRCYVIIGYNCFVCLFVFDCLLVCLCFVWCTRSNVVWFCFAFVFMVVLSYNLLFVVYVCLLAIEMLVGLFAFDCDLCCLIVYWWFILFGYLRCSFAC